MFKAMPPSTKKNTTGHHAKPPSTTERQLQLSRKAAKYAKETMTVCFFSLQLKENISISGFILIRN
jgi:hypothetical protein